MHGGHGRTGGGGTGLNLTIRRSPPGSVDPAAILALILDCFACMHARIDPPSSALRLTVESVAQKIGDEILLTGWNGDALCACAFVRIEADHVYFGKLAVTPACRGQGLARRLLVECEQVAREQGLSRIDLETRIELVENHATFARLGFARISEGRHPGYERPTFILMRKQLADQTA